MTRTAAKHLSLDELIDLETLLLRDESADRQTLRRRDRALGLELADLAHDRRALFVGWLAKMRGVSEDLPGPSAVRSVEMLSLILILIGLLLGLSAALGIFAYTGGHPVNVVYVLGAFVALPVGLLALMLLAVAPRAMLRWVPGARAAQDLTRLINPGRLLPLLRRILPHEPRQSLDVALGRLRAFDRLYGRVRLWLLVGLSQRFAAAFYAGALAGALALIVFSDLAFGWGTTLQIDPPLFHRIVSAIAAPWAWAWGDAVPSRELVEATQYYRQGGVFVGLAANRSPAQLAMLGGWWPFLMAAMAAYGLAPRLVTLAWAHWRLRVALRHVALIHAGYDRLYERLTEPLIESRAATAGSAEPALRQSPAGAPPLERAPMVLVKWEIDGIEDAALHQAFQAQFGARVLAIHRAGGLDLEADARVLAALKAIPRAAHVALLVKAWEAPTRDFSRFLEDARRVLGAQTRLVVVPVDLDEGGSPAAPDERDLAHWARRLAMLGDPHTLTRSLFEDERA